MIILRSKLIPKFNDPAKNKQDLLKQFETSVCLGRTRTMIIFVVRA